MATLRNPVNEYDHQKGNPEAGIILVEYGDYQCAHCGIAHPYIKRLLKSYPQQLLFVFRNFPLREAHLYAWMAALAAEAAGKQNRFWQMHDMIYENQELLDENALFGFANNLGLNIDTFTHDVNSRQIQLKVETDLEGGIRSGVNGTPSFFLNNKKLDSYDETYESLEEAISDVRQ